MTEIEIVENTKSLQAVYHKTLDLLQVIFHKAGTIEHNSRSISVDQRCALMFENGTLVTISDPAQATSVFAELLRGKRGIFFEHPAKIGGGFKTGVLNEFQNILKIGICNFIDVA